MNKLHDSNNRPEPVHTWKLPPSFLSGCLTLGLGGGAGPALLGFLAGLGRVGGGSLRGGEVASASGMEGRGEGRGTWGRRGQQRYWGREHHQGEEGESWQRDGQ